MSIDRRIGNKLPDFVKVEDSPGYRINPGPFLGKIKNNKDPTFSGRLQVWIADFGGDEDNEENWRTVSYASPYMGSTLRQAQDKNNKFSEVSHSYGMWFTVPDIGNLVLCTFVAGDPSRGYWFACIPNNFGKHMIPAIAVSKDYDADNLEDKSLNKIIKHSKLPVVEFNENNSPNWEQFKTIKKPIHEEQLKVLLEQGLDRDDARGVITSNSHRESPSQVYGFSTPGRALKTSKKEYKSGLKVDIVEKRAGGHNIVLDDGDQDGKNNLMRFRTAAGHQIVMNDSENLFYIINSTGTAWVELTAEGKINVYSSDSMNLHTEGDFNLHVDKNININAQGNFNLKTKQNLNVETNSTTFNSTSKTHIYGNGVEIGSQSSIALDAKTNGSFTAVGSQTLTGLPIKLNSGPGPTVNKPEQLPIFRNKKTIKNSNNQWVEQEKVIYLGIVNTVPTHEPWARASGKSNAASSPAISTARSSPVSQPTASTASTPVTATPATVPVQIANNGTATDGAGRPVLSGSTTALSPGIQKAILEAPTKSCPPHILKSSNNTTNPPDGVCKLSQAETRALMTQLAFTESNGRYDIVEIKRGNYLGKYQIGAAALVDLGYIKPDAYKKYNTQAVAYPSSWIGKDNINSKEDFLSNPGVQESAMYKLLQINCKRLSYFGGIKPDDGTDVVAGMLSAAHLLGAGGANTWRRTGLGQDANDTTGTSYFNNGRYAVNTLSKVS